MSEGLAVPAVDVVSHTVPYPVGDFALPHTGASPGVHLTHVVDQGMGAALHTLESLSGVLMAGRAALLTTRVLAQAAIRAADEQHCLEQQEEIAATTAEQWQTTAYAAARANARRAALASRMRRTHAAPGVGGGSGQDGPPRPDLPGPLDPIGRQLGDFRAELARFEDAVRSAEEEWTAWEIGRLTSVAETAATDEAWQRMLRGRQQARLTRHMESRSARTEQQPTEQIASVPAAPAPGQSLDTEAVRQLGADILTALDPGADPKAAAQAADAVSRAVRHAADRAAQARRHLKDARNTVRSANDAARARRADAEWAAAQLDFLTRQAPEGAQPLPEAPDAVAALQRVLDEGGLLRSDARALVARRVKERHDRLHMLFVQAQCTSVLAALADHHGAYAGPVPAEGEAIRLDWTPEGWEPDHWLRATLTGGTFHVTTMYDDSSGRRTRAQEQLDDARCKEAQQQLDAFSETARDLGIAVRFRMDTTKGPCPGEFGADGLIVLGERSGGTTRQDDRDGLIVKQVDQ